MKKRIAVVAICVFLAISRAAADVKIPLPVDRGPLPPRVVNKTIDLLDDDVFLDSESDTATWESAGINTSQYTWIAVRASGEVLLRRF